MIPAKIAGALIVAVPLMVIALITLRRQRPVRLFAMAMILVGVGYLMATGATDDIAHFVLGHGAAQPAAQPAN
ncbi:MAG TPA: hypothetical protein P5114_13485 [Hyphomicrobiaceae bacterium]|nr:hypothetical protein [Hyphomicrobiaceae bacterium]